MSEESMRTGGRLPGAGPHLERVLFIASALIVVVVAAIPLAFALLGLQGRR